MTNLIYRGVLLACAALGILGGSLAHAQTVTRTIGNASVALPVPSGFVDASSDNMMKLSAPFVASNNRLVAVFTTSSYARRIATGDVPGFLTRYAMVQAVKAAEQRGGITASEFEMLRGRLRTDLTKVMETAKARANTELDRNLKEHGLEGSIGDLGTPQVIFDSPAAFAWTQLSSGTVADRGGADRESFRMAVSATMMRLRGQLVVFYAYAKYDNPTDLTWVRTQAAEWVARAGAANP